MWYRLGCDQYEGRLGCWSHIRTIIVSGTGEAKELLHPNLVTDTSKQSAVELVYACELFNDIRCFLPGDRNRPNYRWPKLAWYSSANPVLFHFSVAQIALLHLVLNALHSCGPGDSLGEELQSPLTKSHCFLHFTGRVRSKNFSWETPTETKANHLWQSICSNPGLHWH